MDARYWGVGAAFLLALAGVASLQFQDADEAGRGAADASVRLYQGGYAIVERNATARAPGDFTLKVPEGTLLETVRIEAGDAAVERVSGPSGALQQPSAGDRVRVITDEGEWNGTLLQSGGYVTLATDSGTVYVNPQQVVAIVREGVSAAGREGATITATLSGAEGETPVRVSYLVRGPGWTPAHHLDPDTGRITMYAVVTNAPEIERARLALAVGAPRVAGGGYGPYAPMPLAAESVSGMKVMADFVPSTEGELHLFTLNRTISLSPGAAVRLPVWEGDVKIEKREYVVDAYLGGGRDADAPPASAEERVTIRNTLPVPIPGGTTHFYRNGSWIGSDATPYVPAGGNATLVVGAARDVRATHAVTAQTASPDRTNATERIVVENRKTEPADVRIVLRVPSERVTVTSTTPEPAERAGDRIVWEITVPPGGERAVEATYERYEERPIVLERRIG